MRELSIFLVLVGCLVMATSHCDAMHRSLTFDEIISKADVIFWGKVADQQSWIGANGKMIFTDVYFEVVRLIHEKDEISGHIIGDRIMLTFAGGTLGERSVTVSDVPSFETGSSYLIFTLMDGKTYSSPIIGGLQGLFTVIADEERGNHYPLTYNGRQGINEIRDGKRMMSPPVANIRGGVIEKSSKEKTHVKFYAVAPKPAPGMDQTRFRATVSHVGKEMPGKLMNMDELIDEIHWRIEVKGEAK